MCIHARVLRVYTCVHRAVFTHVAARYGCIELQCARRRFYYVRELRVLGVWEIFHYCYVIMFCAC